MKKNETSPRTQKKLQKLLLFALRRAGTKKNVREGKRGTNASWGRNQFSTIIISDCFCGAIKKSSSKLFSCSTSNTPPRTDLVSQYFRSFAASRAVYCESLHCGYKLSLESISLRHFRRRNLLQELCPLARIQLCRLLLFSPGPPARDEEASKNMEIKFLRANCLARGDHRMALVNEFMRNCLTVFY